MMQTSTETVTFERYQPGARYTQNLLGAAVLVAGAIFAAVGFYGQDPAYYWVLVALSPLFLLFLIFRLRSVTYEIDTTQRTILRKALWAGLLVNSRTLLASDFQMIQRGHFDGSRDSFPTYWAQLIGAEKFTLAESCRGAEVGRVARLAGELLGLEVVGE